MKNFFWIIAIGLLLSGCLETPKGNLPKINQDEIDIEAERQKRISYAKYIDQMSLVKNIGYRINSLNSDICNKIDSKDFIDTRFPSELKVLTQVDFSKRQLDFQEKYLSDNLSEEEKSIFYFNKFTKSSVSTTEKGNQLSIDSKWISNYSKDLINYYSYLNTDCKKNYYSKYNYIKRCKIKKIIS